VCVVHQHRRLDNSDFLPLGREQRSLNIRRCDTLRCVALRRVVVAMLLYRVALRYSAIYIYAVVRPTDLTVKIIPYTGRTSHLSPSLNPPFSSLSRTLIYYSRPVCQHSSTKTSHLAKLQHCFSSLKPLFKRSKNFRKANRRHMRKSDTTQGKRSLSFRQYLKWYKKNKLGNEI